MHLCGVPLTGFNRVVYMRYNRRRDIGIGWKRIVKTGDGRIVLVDGGGRVKEVVPTKEREDNTELERF